MLKAIGDEELQRLLSDFSFPLDEKVEGFVRDKLIELVRKKLFIIYLLIRRTDGSGSMLAGTFTLV